MKDFTSYLLIGVQNNPQEVQRANTDDITGTLTKDGISETPA